MRCGGDLSEDGRWESKDEMDWQRARKPGLVGNFGSFPISNVRGLFQVRNLLGLKRLCRGVSVRYVCKRSGLA